MSTFTWTPSYEATESSKPRVRTTQFGDGYRQAVRFGINTDAKEWSLQFANRTDAERDEIATFLETQGGADSFDWTPPRGTAGKYVCEDWGITFSNCNNNQIRATFKQVFEP